MSAEKPAQLLSSEEILSRKWDKCLANHAIKGAVGLSVGIGLSFLFFRRRAWPIGLSTGFGLGMAYDECTKSFSAEQLVTDATPQR
ncbi:hypothetical protein HK097_002594 [Rhizophlyctis rosea]|uniref:MICOS complex subunit MIC10 n=1 Tax=Rhizophlyctis rosea TaxID=64517 RepID=A0AAD5S523_9FUNG|nr:hypothetical protein HK097_002594 [Rhizophlyctis rosea]